jgi:hypothetical protein
LRLIPFQAHSLLLDSVASPKQTDRRPNLSLSLSLSSSFSFSVCSAILFPKQENTECGSSFYESKKIRRKRRKKREKKKNDIYI